MKFHVFLIFYFIFFGSSDLISDNLSLLEEYKLLHSDLSNIKTYGYKSYFNDRLNKAEAKINNIQGILKTTKSRFNCAILGFGFFKIRLSNGLIGYTRQCELRLNKEFELVNKQYSFYNKIFMPREFDSDTFKIHLDKSISIETYKKEKLIVGKLLTYKVDPELLEYYGEGIYFAKDNKTIENKIMDDDRVYINVIELANYNYLSVLLRMYSILMILSEKQVPNIKFKRELIRIQIVKIANENNRLKYEVMSDYNENQTEDISDYVDQELIFLESILPFIKHDY
ncbi:conserved hypothetical protein [Leptospira interrogans serovar Manilae]|uniref:Uncharacterized protein n=1 Tax=Leptospira interrogans serovar Manilae TaxID=214675 RepID=A0AAQ1P0R0_LEPIR|nr:hypothetical protein [Leptospira interrogans]AKP27484.1 hypothetical protein LIMLP_17130 [Leptospira interrogans serovar Manilae]AKP31256.1 hypothetical protein LIMHP_17125 [Leptospira interrogans serovar Manilae]EMJ56658.1 hypothetical protein LEP1GSC013_4597 [Leptospira interrogans serovar Valbuzzi str. Duyster]ENO72708.1 hypothetical protein LEP1GSC012_2637 [Leptospira interrogans serovar Valbuzzi str. Valbuzzi]EYU64313.1 hypothetical protein CI00_08390 [Leptospira interrogans serovar Ma